MRRTYFISLVLAAAAIILPFNAVYAGIATGAANIVLGQVSFTTNTALTSNIGFNSPWGVAVDTNTGKIFISDLSNNRVLWWNSVTSLSNGNAADGVLGQVNFSTNAVNDVDGDQMPNVTCSSNTLNAPAGMAVDPSGNLWVADSGNNRVLRFPAPLSNFKAADMVLGQANFVSSQTNRGITISSETLKNPRDVKFDLTGNLLVADTGNNRVLKYTGPITTNTVAASLFLGQADFLTGAAQATAQNTLSGPNALSFDWMGNLFVSDNANNRVVEFTGTLANGMAATTVLGQANFTNNKANDSDSNNVADVPASNTLSGPSGIFVDKSTNVWVGDTANNRVIRYNTPISSGMAASVELGQVDFSTNSVNRVSGVNVNTLSAPVSITLDNSGNLWAIDSGNNRSLEYIPLSLTSIAPATAMNVGPVSNVTLSGQELASGMTVKLTKTSQSDISATSVVVGASSTTLTFTFDLTGKTTGFWNVVASAAGTNSALVNAFDIKSVQISSITPNTAPNTGVVFITELAGINFVSPCSVALKKTGQTDITAGNIVITSTKITCTFDLIGKTTGFWDVVVSSNGVNATITNGFDLGLIQVSSITPNVGPSTGTVNITDLAGKYFVQDCIVIMKKTVNSAVVITSATNVNVINPSKLTCTFNLQNQATGYWDIVVSSGNSSATLVNGFNVVMPLTLVSITPNSAINISSVAITNLAGTNFLAGLVVKLTKTGENDITAANVNVITSTFATCLFNLAGRTAGIWDVVASTGSASATISGGFTINTMTIDSITPSSGLNLGVVSITSIHGANLAAGSTVKLSKTGQTDINGSNVVVFSSQVTCTFDLTSKTTGFWDVVVTSGGAAATLANGFEIRTIIANSITPLAGANTGSINITNLSGQNFVSGSTVKLTKTGKTDITATNVNVVNAFQITFTVDLTGAATGFWNVVVTSGPVSSTLPNAFNVVPQITVTSIAPGVATNIHSIVGTITGTNFMSSSTVKLTKLGEEDLLATNITLVSPTQIRCQFDITGKAVGFWNVIVTFSGASGVLVNGFEINTLELASITPASGDNTGIIDITNLAGNNFAAGSIVKLTKTGQADIVASSITIVSAAKITCKLDLTSKTTGFWNVVIASDTISDTLANAFEIKFPVTRTETIDPAVANTVTLKAETGDMSVDIPADTFTQAVAIGVSVNAPSVSDRATLKVSNLGVDITNDKNLQPTKPVTVTIHYNQAALLAAGFTESKLLIARYDTVNSRYITLPTTVNEAGNYASAETDHLSRFAIVQLVAAASLDSVKVYPNPLNSNAQVMTIDNLTADATIKIYTPAGELVATVANDEGSGRVTWNGKNDKGDAVSSGIYLAFIKSSAGNKTVKIAVQK